MLNFSRRKIGRNETGATAVEYALMVGLISIGVITSVTTLRTKTSTTLNNVGVAMTSNGEIPPPGLEGYTFCSNQLQTCSIPAGSGTALIMASRGTAINSPVGYVSTPMSISCLTNWVTPGPDIVKCWYKHS